MKRYNVTIERKDGSEHRYSIFAHNRDDAHDFIKRVNSHNFKRLVSARAETATPKGDLSAEQRALYPGE